MGNTKSLLFVITSLTVLVSGAIGSHFFVRPVTAEPPDPCFGDDCEGTSCNNLAGSASSLECCWTAPSGDKIVCQICNVDENGDFYGCDNPRVTSSTTAPLPPTGVAPPPPPGPGQGGPGNVLPQTPEGLQTGQGPVPKGGLRNLPLGGVFEGL